MKNGLVLLNKPLGITSNQALGKVKRIFNQKKGGLTGILDPQASGVLPICLGEATKLAGYLLDADKSYTATVKVGIATTTGDKEGEITAEGNCDFTLNDFEALKSQFIGDILQIPPMFSALKIDGKPLYELARKGLDVERKQRTVHIYDLSFISYEQPYLTFTATVSKGTYIRVLAEDICKSLGTVGHLSNLVRTQSAGFLLSQCWTLEELEQKPVLISIAQMLPNLPTINLENKDIAKVMHGNKVFIDHNDAIDVLILNMKDEPLAIGFVKNGLLQPKRVFNL
jgi:tRNA pseudouridine55 synthase